jgi:hypothetical protein
MQVRSPAVAEIPEQAADRRWRAELVVGKGSNTCAIDGCVSSAADPLVPDFLVKDFHILLLVDRSDAFNLARKSSCVAG